MSYTVTIHVMIQADYGASSKGRTAAVCVLGHSPRTDGDFSF